MKRTLNFRKPGNPHWIRWTRICGTKGELRWDGSARNAIEVHDFATGEKRLVYPDSIGRLSDFDTTARIFNSLTQSDVLSPFF